MRRCFVPMRPIKIPPQSEAVLESPPMERPFKVEGIVFPLSVSLGPNNNARLSWRDPTFDGGSVPTFFYSEKITPVWCDLSPLSGKEIKVGETVQVRLFNESYGVLEVRAGLFGWPTDEDVPLKTPAEPRAFREEFKKRPEYAATLKLLSGDEP